MLSVMLSLTEIAPVLAQRAIRQSVTSSKPKSFFEAGFWDNWFVGLTGGVATYFGEDDLYHPDGFDKMLTPNVKLSVGKWLRPSYGLRIQAEGPALRGWNDGKNAEGVYTWNKFAWGTDGMPLTIDPVLANNPKRSSNGTGYYQEMRYFDMHLDFMVNLINLWSEYDVNRPVEVMLYAGVGWAHQFNYRGIPRTDELVGKVGTIVDFRLTDRLSGIVELQGSLLNESFDGQVGGRGISSGQNRSAEAYASLTAGVSYRLRNTFSKYEFIDPEVVKELNNRVNDALEENKRLQAQVEEYCPKDSCDKLRRQLKEMMAQPCKEKLYVVVHYIIDKWNVRSSELYKLEEVAAYMERHPEATIALTGYADVKTAYPAYNLKLSERRAREVVRLLTTRFGIKKERIKSKALGDTVQPFRENERNRAVIVIDIE